MDHQRFKQVAPEGTTLYIGGFGLFVELYQSAAGNRWNEYLSVGRTMVGVRFLFADESVNTRYFHHDHLGSIAVITNEAGAVVERSSHDAWGKRRYPNGNDDTTGTLASQTTQGFTGQEELTGFGLVHLNGRVYDPLTGRMMSADPTVPEPGNAQAWNRYAYVINNPLAYTDPTGYSWLSQAFHAVVNFIRPLLGSIIRIGLTALASAMCGPALPLCLAASAAVISAAVTGVQTGSLSAALNSGLIAGATALAFYGVGSLTDQIAASSAPVAARAFNIAGHAAVGCAQSVVSGGQCGSGAAAGAAGSASSPLIGQAFANPGGNFGDLVGGTVATAVAGGLGSVAAGGKFANGAVTGAFGYLSNHLGHMLVGTDAHHQLLRYLQGRERGAWDGMKGFGGMFDGGMPDLVYQSTMPYEVFEIKPWGSEAAGAAQLKDYLDTPGSQSIVGDLGRIFRGPDSVNIQLKGGWFNDTTYTYWASEVPGVVVYQVNDSSVFSEALKLFFSPRNAAGGLGLPPRGRPVRIP